jgi:hypothetical protein
MVYTDWWRNFAGRKHKYHKETLKSLIYPIQDVGLAINVEKTNYILACRPLLDNDL